MNPLRSVRNERRRGMLKGKGICCAAFVLVFLLLAVPGLPALEKELPEGPVSIEADSIAYEGDTDTFHALGKVLITFAGGFLKADAVNLNRSTNMALAEGHVFVRSDQDVLEGDKVTFDIVAKTGVVNDGRMFIARNHFYIKGEKIEKTGEATYRLENATVTTCDGETPDWRLAGSELDLTIDGYGTLKHGRFLARDIPLLYVPYLIFPAKTTRQSGLLFPRFSYSRDKNGLDVELPFYWAISGSADATLSQRYLEKRGWKEGLEFRYFPTPETFGTFYADFINDRKHITETVGTMSRDWQGDRNRWSYYLNHESTFSSGLSIRSDIQRVSDHWYFRDFASFNYYLDNYPQTGEERFQRVSFRGDESLGSLDSTVRLTKDWSLYNLTGLARYTDDFSTASNDATLQKYPEVTLTGFRRPLAGSPLQFEFTAGYDYLYRGEGQKGHLGEIAPTLYLPMNLGRYVQMTPQAGFRGSIWERSDSATDRERKYGDREVFQLGAALSTEVNRVYDFGGTEVEKIRHGIKPEITYSFIPSASQDNIPDYLARIPNQHSLTYALTNTLLARTRGKDGTAGYREMMRLKLAQTFDILESRRDATGADMDNRPFGDVTVELDLSPLPYLALSARNIYSVNSGGWKQSNYDLAISDTRGDTAAVGYRYTRDALEEVNLYLKAAVTSSLDAIYILRHNIKDGATVESTYGVKYRRQCWYVEVDLSNRADDRTIMFYVSLLGMGT
ncbi:MAG: LPS-assembly protein LptD [Syntrophales bacterium]